MEITKVKPQKRPQLVVQAVIQNADDYQKIIEAAESQSLSVSSFVRHHVLSAANKVVSQSLATS